MADDVYRPKKSGEGGNAKNPQASASQKEGGDPLAGVKALAFAGWVHVMQKPGRRGCMAARRN